MLLFKQTLAFLSLTLVCLLSSALDADRTVYVTKDVSTGLPRSRLLSPTVKPQAFPATRIGSVELTSATTSRLTQTRF
jgi:hypothetical protein